MGFSTLTSAQIDDLMTLMHEFDPTIAVSAKMLERAAVAGGSTGLPFV